MEIINIEDKSYEIVYKYEKSSGVTSDQLIKFKNNRHCDILIQNNFFYFICNEIKNVEFEDISITE